MREQIGILEGIWGDEPVHASTVSHDDETFKKTTRDRIEMNSFGGAKEAG